MARSRECPSCGYELNHLEGVTGRISMCARCGWNRVVLASGPRSRERTARREPLGDVQRLRVS
ncbi:MAG TPA: lysine biosynthesis protein LysW [Anaerolineae bacterium]|nr:lysine biosynthesis protein LysW [Anaerolineae bacterium]